MAKDDKPDAWMPLYIGDWDSGTRHLDCEQDGAYGRLVRHYWKNGPLPDDDVMLARIVGMDARRWRKVRPILAAFFIIEAGAWRHARVEQELERWTAKRARAIERARAGGHGKAAKSSATSSQQALLKRCTSSSSREVEGLTGPSTLSAKGSFSGPKEVRAAFVAALGADWTRSYIDPCGWQDIPERALIPSTAWGRAKLEREGRAVLAAEAIKVVERAA